MNTRKNIILLIFFLGTMSFAEAPMRNGATPWLPTLTQPIKEVASSHEELAIIRLLNENRQTPEAIWVVKMDVNGDHKEDAIVTIATREAAGARGILRTQTTYVLLGNGQLNAVFDPASSKLWFSIQTCYEMNQTKYPDVAIRRQFTILSENDMWKVKILETRYTNLAGDAGTRGMQFDSVAESAVPVSEMKNWSPKISE